MALLGQIAPNLLTIDLACNRCDRRGRLNTPRLVAERGPNMPVPALLPTIAADCPRMQAAVFHAVCDVHLPQLSKLGV